MLPEQLTLLAIQPCPPVPPLPLLDDVEVPPEPLDAAEDDEDALDVESVPVLVAEDDACMLDVPEDEAPPVAPPPVPPALLEPEPPHAAKAASETKEATSAKLLERMSQPPRS